MCGIAGLLDWEAHPDIAVVKAMTDRLFHRGPDAGNALSSGPVALGHRRLSIIDVSENNNQPFYDSTNKYMIVFNGEIYNFPEIKESLQKKGVVFRTRGDTEVVIEAYKYWDTNCLEKFNGMFAFAIWDSKRERLFIARDRLGEKPLFYSEFTRGGFAFASEPAALSLHPKVGRHVDPEGLHQYLSLNYTLNEHSLYQGIKKLLPAHMLIVERNKPITIKSYWNLASCFESKRYDLTLESAKDELLNLIDDSVKLRLVSDVPLGAFLSGGIDSAAIVASMAKLMEPQQVRTFSVGFDFESYNELEQAKETARILKVTNQSEFMSPSHEDILKSLIHAIDEPLADSSVLPTFHLAKFTRQHVKVSLSGDGGDECFGGYETYIADKIHHSLGWLPKQLFNSLYSGVTKYWPVSHKKISFDYKLRQLLLGLSFDKARAHYTWREIFSETERNEILHPDFTNGVNTYSACNIFRNYFDEIKGGHYLDRAMYTDIKTWLADDILTKVDRATMANSLETRVPLLDHRIVEFAATLPVSLKIKGLNKKYILKRSQAERLPKSIFNRKKQGFNAPIAYWLEGPLKDISYDVLNSSKLHQWLNKKKIETMWIEQLKKKGDHSLKLFALICFGLWLNQN